MDARKLAVQLLMQTEKQNQYSNLALDHALDQSNLPEQERRFCAALYYGVMERRITLDYILRHYSKKKLHQLDAAVLQILRIGIYQLKYMDRVPDAAAIHTCVALTRSFRKSSASGFVNAVLRQYVRDEKKVPESDDPLEAASVLYAVPIWLEKKLVQQYGKQAAHAFLENALQTPPITIRRNVQMGDAVAFQKAVPGANPHPVLPDAYLLHGTNVKTLPGFQEGWFHVQDLASQFCSLAVGAKPGETVLDLCAAPGGKTFTIAQYMQDTGTLLAFDLQPARVSLIQEGAKRLHLHCITAAQGDAAVYREELPKADRILCDVPCSGLGVIRRKPEIKEKNPAELAELPVIQLRILETASQYLKENGTLLYSTCTVLKEENEQVVRAFLRTHPDFEAIPVLPELGASFDAPMVTLLPQFYNSDGFFMAKLRRKSKQQKEGK